MNNANNSYNTDNVYYLRGLCLFQFNNKNAAINDMKKAGDMGAKFLNDYGYFNNKTSSSIKSEPQRQNPSKVKTKIIPELKKTR